MPLHSFCEGRLYQFEIVSISIAANDSAVAPFDERPERRVVHYWLCGRCAGSLGVQLDPRRGLYFVPLEAQMPVEETAGRRAEEAIERRDHC